MKKMSLLACLMLLTTTVALCDEATAISDIRKKISEKLVNSPIDHISKNNEMPDLYEIHSGINIFYTDKTAEHVLIGHIFDMNGTDLTQNKIDIKREAMKKQAEDNQRQYELKMESLKKNIDLTKALKIGSGKHEVIVFTDTECPFCRKADEMISEGDMTKYIFFSPLPRHKKAKPQAIHILCSKDPANEFNKAMRGELDSAKLLTCKAGEEKLEEMLKIGEKMGVQGTPLFFIDGKFVRGANPIIKNLVK